MLCIYSTTQYDTVFSFTLAQTSVDILGGWNRDQQQLHQESGYGNPRLFLPAQHRPDPGHILDHKPAKPVCRECRRGIAGVRVLV